MTVAILGCGPAGLMAAKACWERGRPADIYAYDGLPSPIIGAQYLHIPILGVTEVIPSAAITYIKRGTAEGYAYKIYRRNQKTSWDRWPQGVVNGYPLRLAYDILYRQMEKDIQAVGKIDETMLKRILFNHDLVISTIPPVNYCRNRDEHHFATATTWIEEWDDSDYPPWTIVYNGEDGVPWHRASNLEGQTWAEYALPVWGAAEVKKPQSTNCDCYPDVIRVGRFGKWTRDVLSSDAYTEVLNLLG